MVERSALGRNQGEGPMIRTFPAITLWQPWVSLVFAGVKRHETRGFPIPAKYAGGWIALHAALRGPNLSPGLFRVCYDTFGERGRDLPCGVVVGLARFGPCRPVEEAEPYDARDRLCGDWRSGRWAWPVLETIRVEQPSPPVRGRQGWFSVGIETPPGDLRFDSGLPLIEDVAAFGIGHLPRVAA